MLVFGPFVLAQLYDIIQDALKKQDIVEPEDVRRSTRTKVSVGAIVVIAFIVVVTVELRPLSLAAAVEACCHISCL
jgi:hypothetical protein